MDFSQDLVVIGGGAAGIFAAINAKAAAPQMRVLILEKSAKLLAKVRVSGGGRCNVTHDCFDPKLFAQNYPRGSRELLGPLHHFGAEQIVQWFAERGVALKTEKDGRMFPTTDSSETIVHCLLGEAKKVGVEIEMQQKVQYIEKGYIVHLAERQIQTRFLLLATGSSKQGYKWSEHFGHTIVQPIPSLFTLHSPTSPLLDLSGIAVENATLHLGPFSQTGPLLLTHFGFSGPAVIKLSAWAAKYLYKRDYKATLQIEWPEQLPRRLRKRTEVTEFQIDGKTTHKEEFVTCGGIALKEVNFKTFESKLSPGLFFAGEILDIDGITGGFNFQNAWTSSYLAAQCNSRRIA